MSRPTPPPRYIARPASVVIRTVRGDAVAWNRASGRKHLMSPKYAEVLARIPSRWIEVEALGPTPSGVIEQLLQVGLIVERPDDQPG